MLLDVVDRGIRAKLEGGIVVDLDIRLHHGEEGVSWRTEQQRGLNALGRERVEGGSVRDGSEGTVGLEVTECYADRSGTKRVRLRRSVEGAEEKVVIIM